MRFIDEVMLTKLKMSLFCFKFITDIFITNVISIIIVLTYNISNTVQ